MKCTKNDKIVFWGAFIALITTSMAFIIRAILINSGVWPEQFGLDKVQSGVLFGAGIWPFAISIILFSLVIDRVGYKFAMFFSFACYATFGALALIAYSSVNGQVTDLAMAQAKAWNYLYWGSVILGLGNGTVEAFINPVVATLFKDEKSKWLNMLHAGWPGGLVLGGILAIGLAGIVAEDWRILVALMFLPALIYLIMLARVEFPVNERVAAGSSYREMLAQLGTAGAFIAFYLIFAQLGSVFDWATPVTWGLIAVSVISYALYSRSFGNPLLLILVIIMMPLATTELGTDGWISALMEKPMHAAGWDPTWVLVYTSAIMMVLRFNAGPVIQKFGPLGLLAMCSGLAILGLYLLSFASAVVFIFVAATVYGVAKTYFWPTMLGVVAEQTPKGGALTLNAIAGIGMLTVGILGGPFIGYLQESSVTSGIKQELPAVYETVTQESDYLLGHYTALNQVALGAQPEAVQEQVVEIQERETQGALAKMAMFPAFMLVCYIGLILFFKSKGGYRPKVLGGAHAD
ncbi:MFS transporter [Coraliomargarita algicola]|uniref:MFS transporter n=1 Tax=Coraliomargarita algicola TaxID=3092156 RepID=A0ABZ0RMK1_9BACT|nr:MFS transporter [Coraliomargarita sp. J2-16]WPJ96220.1 MFS transporter [Coraliomargarita sp. J2-16]